VKLAIHVDYAWDACEILVEIMAPTAYRPAMTSSATLDPTTLSDGLVRIGDEAIAKPNEAALDAYFADEFVFHGPGGDATLDDLKQLWAGMREAFTGFAVTRDQILVEGNFVAARTRMSGIFEREFAYGPIGPVQPTGKPVSFQIFNFFRYDNEGRLAEEWAQLDNLGLLKQLGVEMP
jgi:predicted ester cyclase